MQVMEPRQRLWTKAEYYRMAELGWFDGQRVELIEGEILTMAPQDSPHFSGTDKTADVLRKAFGPAYWIRMQGPLDLGAFLQPEPDVSVVPGKREDYRDHPKTAVLVVEVSLSSLAYDRKTKGPVYAKAGILEYWIVNLADRQLEVYRNPVPDGAHPLGFRYDTILALSAKDSVTPLALPGVKIAVSEILG
jgi:Uma2 family endonuclease